MTGKDVEDFAREHSITRVRVGDWELEDGHWMHRPWFKVAVNTALRAFQTRHRPARLFVLTTRCDDSTTPPTVLGYAFGWVEHRKDLSCVSP